MCWERKKEKKKHIIQYEMGSKGKNLQFVWETTAP